MIFAICNPAAGHGRSKKIGEMVDQYLSQKNIPYRMVYTCHPGHAAELAAEGRKMGAQMVLSIGGDGTSFETAQGLMHTDTPMGIIPAGTGNDFIKTIGMDGGW